MAWSFSAVVSSSKIFAVSGSMCFSFPIGRYRFYANHLAKLSPCRMCAWTDALRVSWTVAACQGPLRENVSGQGKPPPLVFTTTWRGVSVGGFVAVDHGLQFHPATPQSDPAGEAIALAILVASQACQMHVERFHTWFLSKPLAVVSGQNFDVHRGDDLRRRPGLGVGRAGCITQGQQRRGHHREHRDRRFQPLDRVEL